MHVCLTVYSNVALINGLPVTTFLLLLLGAHGCHGGHVAGQIVARIGSIATTASSIVVDVRIDGCVHSIGRVQARGRGGHHAIGEIIN